MILQLLRFAVGVAICVLFVRTFVVQGLLWPRRVVSESMAPSLLGPHREQQCGSCSFRWPVELAAANTPEFACPNCGSPATVVDTAPQLGQRVLINRAAYLWEPPRRGDRVVFRSEAEPDEIAVKRIVGMPGETVEIREGDLFIDGARYQKSLAEQRQVAISVHDDRFRHAHDGMGRAAWRVAGNSAWRRSTSGWRLPDASPDAERSSADWLGFHPIASNALGTAIVQDDLPFNTTTSRRLHPMNDLMLVCRVTCHGEGRLKLRVRSTGSECQVVLDPVAGRVEAIVDSIMQTEATTDDAPHAVGHLLTGAELIASTFDRQLIVSIAGTIVVRLPWEVAPGPTTEPFVPFAFSVRGMAVSIADLQVYRDLYYLPPPRGGYGSTPAVLSEAGYFVLGDNSARSRDSRDPELGLGIESKQLLGKVLECDP